ncbi:MAG: DUF4157 domain-containing protein [Bacteroidota bacterium]
MSYLKSATGKTFKNSSSSSENLTSKQGISAPAVPALQRAADEEEVQMKKVPAQLMEEEEPLQGKFDPVQRAGMEEEEPLQGKFTAQLAAEEEEPLQGKFDPVQRAGMEEEEPLQGKFTAQLAAEEEEPLQGKFDPVQRAGMEEEEPLQGKFTAQLAAEEEEPLQGKFDPVQRAGMGEEEPLQGKFTAQLAAEEEEPLQGKFEKKSAIKPFQLKSSSTSDNSGSAIQKKDDGAQSSSTGMPSHLKSGIENLSGFSMDDVKVHYNSDKPKQLKAHAYAQGTNIHIGPGQEKHLPHEAWHVAQQKQGRVQATMQMKGKVPVNDDTGLETEADVMGERAVKTGRDLESTVKTSSFTPTKSSPALQKVAQLKIPPTGSLPMSRLVTGQETMEQEKGKKSEDEEGMDSFVDTYSGMQGAATDFMGSSPLSYTNSSNTKIDETTGQTVVDEDKTVVDNHKSDPLGKGASAAAVGAGMYTGIFGMYQAVQKFRDGEVNDKIEGLFAMGSSLSTMAKSGSDMAKTTAKEGSDTAKEAGKASSIAGTVTDGLDAVKTLVLTIKGVYDAYQDATSDAGSSTKEKLETGMATVRGLVEAAGKAVSAGKTIADMLQAGSAGLASAVPGLGIALSSIDLAISIYNLIKAKSAESAVKEQLKKNMWEAGGSKTLGKGSDGRKQRDLYVKTFETEITAMKAKKITLAAEKATLVAAGSDTAVIDKKITDLDLSLAGAEFQLAALNENNALTHLKGVNKDRKYNAGFEIGVNMVKIVGDVLALVPEPGSQVAGMSLKLIAGGSKVAKGLGSKILQWGRDKAAGAPDSKLAKIFDATKSGDAVKERNKGTIKYIFTLVKGLPPTVTDPTFKAKNDVLESMITSVGCEPQALYRAVGTNNLDAGVQLLYKSIAK